MSIPVTVRMVSMVMGARSDRGADNCGDMENLRITDNCGQELCNQKSEGPSVLSPSLLNLPTVASAFGANSFFHTYNRISPFIIIRQTGP